MTTKKWAIRIIAASVFFTAIICLSAPAHAQQAPMTQDEVVSFIKHESSCYVVAGLAGLRKQQARHLFNLSEFTATHMVDITYAAGFTDGWMAAIEHSTGVSKSKQAAGAHELMCLERA